MDIEVVPADSVVEWRRLITSLNLDTHYRSNIFERVEKQDSAYIVIEDIEKAMFNEQQIRHWNKNIKQSYELFVKIKDSYLHQLGKPT